jgi:hypothetical protein
LAEGLASLTLGFGVHEVGEAFGFGEVELAVLEGAAGELARLRWPHAGLAKRCVDDGGNDGRAAMNVEFGDVFAGEARWAWKPERQAVIERKAGARIAKGFARRHAWRRQSAGCQRTQARARFRSGQADHGNASAASAGRKRCDRVRFHVKNSKRF